MALLIISTIFILHSICVRAFDPCAVGNHKEFPTYGFGARKDNCSQELLAPCDYYLKKQWYTSSLGSLSNACPTVGSCGVAYPAWIDGQLPGVADGIVNRTVCIKRGTVCCAQSDLTAQIKNCNGFFVYNLPPLNECPSAYCFASDLPCELTTANPVIQSTTTVRAVTSRTTANQVTSNRVSTSQTSRTTANQTTSTRVSTRHTTARRTTMSKTSTLPIGITTMSSTFDPCAVENHKEFPTYGFGARKENCSQELLAPCDYYLEKQWYTSSLGSLSNVCPTVGSCGVAYPAWIDGQLPGDADGIVKRTVCIKKGTRCCAESGRTAQIKNCKGFFVFNLPPLNECPSAYCFASDLLCELTTANPVIQSTTTVRAVTSRTTANQVTSNRVSTSQTSRTTANQATSTRVSTRHTTARRTTMSKTSTLPIGITTMSSKVSEPQTLLTGIGIGSGVVLLAVGAAIAVYLVLKYKDETTMDNTVTEKTDHDTCFEDHIYATVDSPSPYTSLK